MNLGGLESDLEEVHRLLSLTSSALVRDRLHLLLNELLQKKHLLLASDNTSTAFNTSAAQARVASSAAADAGLLSANFANSLSLSAAPSGPTATSPHRTRSLTDSADTRSTNSGKDTQPIEPILPNLSRQSQQDAGLSPFDPVWQPGRNSGAALPLVDGTFKSARELQQAASALAQIDGFVGIPGYAREAFSSEPLQQPTVSAGLGVNLAALQRHSNLGSGSGSNSSSWLQQQGGYQSGSSNFSGIQHLVLGGQQQPVTQHQAKALLQGLSGGYGAGNGGLGGAQGVRGFPGGASSSGYGSGRMEARRGGSYGGSFSTYRSTGGNSSYGGGPLYGANVLPSYLPPVLQYGVDLRHGELDARGNPLFRPLTTYSWEQSETLVKIYVPLRGVQTDLLRATFTPTALEIRVVALQGKNYIYTAKPLYLPINSDCCHVAASKTKKNVLITLQKLRCDTPEEKHWRDLTRDVAAC